MNWFYLKLYDFSWKRKFIKENQIIWKTNYSAQIDGSFSDIKVQIKTQINNTEYQIWDFIKIFYWNEIYYQGYIIFINRNLKSNNEFLELTIITKWNFIANKTFTKKYNDSPKNILLDIIWLCNQSFWQTMISIWKIEDINLKIEIDLKDINFLNAIIELIKTINDTNNKIWKKSKHFFIDFDGKIDFWDNDYKIHKITLWRDIFEINIWNTNKDVIKSATFHNLTNIKLNNNYNYKQILPMHLIKIRNISYKIQPLNVEKINYNDLWADVFLESFVSFSNLIKEIWN